MKIVPVRRTAFIAVLLPRLGITAGVVSLAASAYVFVAGVTFDPPWRDLGVVEVITSYLLLAAVARWARPLRSAIVAGVVLWSACVAWALRLLGESTAWPITSTYDLFVVVGNLAAAALFPTVAVVAGGLPRYLAHRRLELIAAVRREQRLELAQDLHDFVAHDMTGIVAQAQAAQFARADDVDHLRAALERIEQVGVAALDTMDGLIQVLHDGDVAQRSMQQIVDVPALVERFRAGRKPGSVVRIELDDQDARVSPQVQATVYRVVVEGLTNVRRHAAWGAPVTVSLGTTGDGSLVVEVLNDVTSEGPERRRHPSSGTGLVALRERVSAVGGNLSVGPDGAGRWRLQATLPTLDEEA